ncbi:MAG: MaoC family dehydratase N-terminal domain-containing protein [Dehalococcoidia bacterium]|nr:MaoC family dehydratase N-terminal domain-containing protein [Dehalococcoidia bacterium]
MVSRIRWLDISFKVLYNRRKVMTNPFMLPPEKKVEFHQIEVGYQFPPASINLEASRIALYLGAVGETSNLYQETSLVPPSAIAACAQAALAEKIVLLPGTIHISQELEFVGIARVCDTLTSRARVSRKQERGKMRLLNIDIEVLDRDSKTIMKGKSSFILPQSD